MRRAVILDTGPLVALVDARDQDHGWTVDQCQVLTLDRDFKVYRKHGRQVIPLIIPR